MIAPVASIGRLLEEVGRGNESVLAELVPLVYDELKRIARGYLRRERDDHTLQTTALVHEAYLRLAGQDELAFQNRAHFRAIAASTMRRILVEHARARNARKRGGALTRVRLDDALEIGGGRRRPLDLEAVDQALDRLQQLDPRLVRLVELRFFGGLTVEETGTILGVSPATVKREWATARAWLRRELGDGRARGD